MWRLKRQMIDLLHLTPDLAWLKIRGLQDHPSDCYRSMWMELKPRQNLIGQPGNSAEQGQMVMEGVTCHCCYFPAQ